jgi:thioredoxin 1
MINRGKSFNETYVRFSSYSGNNSSPSPSQPSQDNRFSNAPPPPVDNRFSNTPPPVHSRFSNAPPPSSSGPSPSPGPHRVYPIQSEKLFELLEFPQHHLTKDGKPTKIVVKVYTDWCGPCKQVAPDFEKLSMDPEHQDILFLMVDGEKIGPNLMKYIKVSAVPVFFLFYMGKQFGDMVVGPNIQDVKNACTLLSNKQ